LSDSPSNPAFCGFFALFADRHREIRLDSTWPRQERTAALHWNNTQKNETTDFTDVTDNDKVRRQKVVRNGEPAGL
jgi:hypothetical protein